MIFGNLAMNLVTIVSAETASDSKSHVFESHVRITFHSTTMGVAREKKLYYGVAREKKTPCKVSELDFTYFKEFDLVLKSFKMPLGSNLGTSQV